jgi:hypothetical protein
MAGVERQQKTIDTETDVVCVKRKKKKLKTK